MSSPHTTEDDYLDYELELDDNPGPDDLPPPTLAVQWHPICRREDLDRIVGTIMHEDGYR